MPIPQSFLSEQLKWFENLVGFLKIRTLALYLKANSGSETDGNNFEQMWPGLFDNMLHRATRESCSILRQKVQVTNN
jgi:hypothetical protein